MQQANRRAMCSVIVVTLAVVVFLEAAAIASKLDWDYPVFSARCKAKCLLSLRGSAPTQQKILKRPEFNKCAEECLKEGWTKPGDCDHSSSNVTSDSLESVFQETCLLGCRSDVDCPGFDKCCSHSCGASCRSPLKLINNPYLPGIPKNVITNQTVEQNATDITLRAFAYWSLDGGKSEKGLVFLIEERHHLGCNFSEKRLSPWTLVRRELRPRVNLQTFATFGRWYQLRVAAVNENGSRGFSEPSKPFSLFFEPSVPDAPVDIVIASMAIVNGSIWAELHWKPPFSNLPITRYKVCWGHPIEYYSNNNLDSHVADSVYVRCASVPKDQHFFFIQDLNSSNEYMVHVQAFASYCKKKLKGLTQDIRFSVVEENDELIWFTDTTGPNRLLRIEELMGKPKVERVELVGKELSAHVIWDPPYDHSDNLTYELSWRQMDCPSVLAATTDETFYDINGLRFNSKYTVTLKTKSYLRFHASFVDFKTPSCEEFKNHSSLNCESAKRQTCRSKVD